MTTPSPELVSLAEELAKWVGGAILGKEVVRTLLMPSAEYVAANLRGVLERVGNVNVGEIFKRYFALTDSAQRIDAQAVHPRVIQRVLEDGSLSDDPLTQEYFARILLGSRNKDPDDRAISMISVVRNLGSAEIWLHAALYRSWLSLFGGSEFTMAEEHTEALTVRLVTNSEQRDLEDAAIGLASAGLVRIEAAVHGQPLLRPSIPGARLFMWIIGRGSENVNRLFRTSDVLEPSGLPCFETPAVFLEHLSTFRRRVLSDLTQSIDDEINLGFNAPRLFQLRCALWPLKSITMDGMDDYILASSTDSKTLLKRNLRCDRAQLLMIVGPSRVDALGRAGTDVCECESCNMQLFVPACLSRETLLQWDSDYHGDCTGVTGKHNWEAFVYHPGVR